MQLNKKFPAFYRTRRFITKFTRVRHWSLSWARWTQSTPCHPISLISILILSSHLRQDLPSGLLPSGFPTKISYPLLISPMRAKWPAHLILLDFITLKVFGEVYKLWSSSLWRLLQPYYYCYYYHHYYYHHHHHHHHPSQRDKLSYVFHTMR